MGRKSLGPVSVQAVIGLVMAGLICLLSGCGGGGDHATAPTRPAGPATSAPSPGPLNRLLQRLVTVIDDHDRAGYAALLSDRDPGFASTAGMIMDNLVAIDPGDVTLRATGHTRTLAPRRAELLGDGGYAAEVRLTWSVPGDRGPSATDVWLTVVPTAAGDAVLWAGTTDGPDDARPTPLWWLEPIRYVDDHHATVIAGASVDAEDWLARADRAVADVTQRLSGAASPAADWNRRLVVIIPSNEDLLEQMLGVGDGAEAGLAAVTWPDGPEPDTAPIRVMINPAGVQGGLSSDIVLTHETVHVATASPASPAPTWLIEGLADDIAYDTYPQARGSAAAALLQRVRRSGPPARLPDEQAFRSSGDDLDLAYAEAWLACYDIARRYGRGRLLAFYTAVGRTPTGAINPAARSTLGVDQDQLVAGWRQFLREAAARGSI